MPYEIWQRQRTLVNTDPQRRCYDGRHFSYDYIWSRWEHLEDTEDPHPRLAFWQDLNAYAVRARGLEAKREFEIRTRP